MKYKVLKGTKLFNKLVDIQNEIQRCNKVARDFVEGLGYTKFRKSRYGIGGGISSIICESGKPVGWKKSYTELPNEYMPAKIKKNDTLLKAIDNLPKVDENVINKLLDYDPWKSTEESQVGYGMVINVCPEVHWKKSFILIGISERYITTYKPVRNMIEIMGSEFEKLKIIT